MGWSLHHKTGLIHSSPQQTYRCYTLVATNRGRYHANLLSMAVLISHPSYSEAPICYPYLLPNPPLLFRTSPPPAPGSCSERRHPAGCPIAPSLRSDGRRRTASPCAAQQGDRGREGDRAHPQPRGARPAAPPSTHYFL